MRCGDGGSQSGESLLHGGRNDGQNENVLVLRFAGHLEGYIILSAQHRDNGSFGQHRIEAHAFQTADELFCVFVQAFDAPGFIQNDLEGFVRGGGLGRRQRSREDVRAAGVAQVGDDVFLRGHISTDGWDGLAERAHLDIDLAVHVVIFFDARAFFAEHTQGMGFIDHQPGVVFFTQLHHLGQVNDIAVHAEDGVRDDHLGNICGSVPE